MINQCFFSLAWRFPVWMAEFRNNSGQIASHKPKIFTCNIPYDAKLYAVLSRLVYRMKYAKLSS